MHNAQRARNVGLVAIKKTRRVYLLPIVFANSCLTEDWTENHSVPSLPHKY